MELEVEITRLGAQGDGVADGPAGPIFVPFTLPGERVRVVVDGENDYAKLVDVFSRALIGLRRSARISGYAVAARFSTWRPKPISVGSVTRSSPRYARAASTRRLRG
jgi:TRAM domain-containing protein